MAPALIFLIVLLIAVLAMNWRFLKAGLGFSGAACNWSRIDGRDQNGRKAWFCTTCRREEWVEGSDPPPECGKRFNGPTGRV
ncbi:MAG: hypothetical protein OEN23_11780 [Paracoccaceae bacterium]|nr:hypothetical protein [Paracoccaceae bacterium]